MPPHFLTSPENAARFGPSDPKWGEGGSAAHARYSCGFAARGGGFLPVHRSVGPRRCVGRRRRRLNIYDSGRKTSAVLPKYLKPRRPRGRGHRGEGVKIPELRGQKNFQVSTRASAYRLCDTHTSNTSSFHSQNTSLWYRADKTNLPV